MTKRKLFLLFLIFILCDALVWLGCILFLPESKLLVGFVLTVCGATVLLVYTLVSKLSAAAPPPPAAAVETQTSPSGKSPGPSPVSALIQEANERLGKSPKLASQRVKSTITDFPLYLVLGAEGSGKTSLFLASKSEPELLAGQVHRESVVVPTRLANIWFAENAVVVEGAGEFFSGEDARWDAFLASFHRPGKSGFTKIFGGREETKLSGVVLCCDAGVFVGVPDSARLGALGRLTHQRLRLVAEHFGSDVPVYLVFTKSDSIKYFSEYFGRLNETEDQQILGCTFPSAGTESPSNETILARLNSLYSSLADRRLGFLERERDLAKRPAIYEFPREFKRLRGSLAQFLQDVFRDKPLQPNPRLAGVYFTGTRKVVGRGDDLERSGIHKVGDVTRILRAEDLERFRSQAPDSRQRESEITRWSFVSDLWQQILERRLAMGTGQYVNRRQQLYRQVTMVSAVAVSSLAILLFAGSFLGNRSFVSDVRDAVLGCEALPPGGTASIRNLQGIGELRAQIERLVANRPGFWMHFGFYRGAELLDAVWPVYYSRFRAYFLNIVARRLEGELSGLPAEKNASFLYDRVFESLKTYRTITRSPNEASCKPGSDLADRLTARWRQGRSPDADAERIARENFRFYTASLKAGRIPEELQAQEQNEEVTQRGRAYLNNFKGAEAQYQQIIEKVNQEKQSSAVLINLIGNDKYRSVIHVDEQMPAAFTRPDGWDRVHKLIDEAANGNAGESCVLGAGGSRIGNLAGSIDLKKELREFYARDYIERWRAFLANTSILPYGGCGDAASKLAILKENNSPILAVLLLTAQNTAFPKDAKLPADLIQSSAPKPSGLAGRALATKEVAGASKLLADLGPGGTAEQQIAAAFQPAQAVFEKSPPDPNHWTDAGNTPYLSSLGALQQALGNLDRGGKCDATNQSGNMEASAQLAKARMAVDELRRKFNIKGVNEEVTAILEAPLAGIPALIVKDPAVITKKQVEGALQRVCQGLSGLNGKYPFNPNSTTDAATSEVLKVFHPKVGLLAGLQQAVGEVAVKAGGTWAQKPDAPVKLSAKFLDFLNRMSDVSLALFSPQGDSPGMKYRLTVRPSESVARVTGKIDGKPFQMVQTEYDWPSSAGEIELRVEPVSGGSIPIGSYSGTWAIFMLLSGADHTPGTNLFRVINIRGEGRSRAQPILSDRSPVLFEVTQYPNGVRNAFDKGFFGLSCPKQIFE